MTKKPPRPWRRYATNLAVSAGAFLALGLLLEIFIRLTGLAYDPQYDRRGKGILVPSNDPEIRRELPANFDGEMLGAPVRTNSYGMRGPELPVVKPSGTIRIAVLGDSWAFGWGVEQGGDFPAVLEELLSAVPGGPAVEVLNFSVSAYNSLQELAVLKRKAMRFSPDLVIIAYNINDVEHLDPGEPASQAPTIRRLISWLDMHSHLVRLIDDRLRRLALQMSLETPGKVAHYARLYEEDSAEWVRVQAALEEMRDVVEASGGSLYLVVCPWMSILNDDNPYRNIHRGIVAAAESLSVPALDLFPYFEGRDVKDLRISPLDGHPTAEGHRIAAEAIAADLHRRNLVPSPEKRSSELR